MSAALREYVLVVQESAFQTPAATPTLWTTATSYGLTNFEGAYVRLADGNAFTARARPVQVETPYGGGFAVPAYRVSDKQEIKGKLRIKLTVGQAPFWLSWASQRVSGSGTAPWATTEQDGDLPSCTIYHAKLYYNGTTKRTGYYGCKVDAWSLTVSEASTEAMLDLDVSCAYQKGNQFDSSADPDSTEFPAPADDNFAIDPYVFIYAGGSNYVTFGGTVRTQFTDLTISSQNALARRFFANRYLAMLRFMGRRTTVAMKNLYVATTDRTHYEAVTSQGVSIELNNATHGFTYNFEGQNVFDPFEDDLPLGDLYFENGTELNMWDPTAHADFTLAIT